MRSTRLASAGAASVALILMLSIPQAAEAATFVGEPSDWTFVGGPVVTTLGSTQVAEVTFDNHLGVSVLGLVMLVLRNNVGQTLYYSTATISMTEGSYGTVYIIVAGVSPGMDYATIFAMTIGGLAISNATTIAFSVQ